MRKYNNLQKYIFEKTLKEYHKETVNGLFRAMIEPVIENQKFESCILLRLLNLDEKASLIKRLSFSNSSIFSFSDELKDFNYENIQNEQIWDNTEFLIIIGARYSAALIWDYSLSVNSDYTNVCLLYNSKNITEIAKEVIKNSIVDIKDIVLKNIPDRRENILLNKSINLIANSLNAKNEEIIFSELEKSKMLKDDDRLQTAAIVAEKAKFIAHEIKNNLSIINLYSKISQKRLENIAAAEDIMQSLNKALENITFASENISSHINDLRCLSAPYKTDISLNQIILPVIMQCSAKASDIGVDIILNDFNDVVVNTDKVKVQCALLNIIYNAIEACKTGNKIIIDVIIESDYIKILIKNNGEKISEKIQEKIFETDFTTKEKGNGLGLSICKTQLNLIGGEIKLLCSTDEETIFEINFAR